MSIITRSSHPIALLGCPIQICPERARRASPVTYATADATVSYMHWHDCCLVPPLQSRDLQEALRQGRRSHLEFIEGAVHGGDAFETAENRELVDDFLDRQPVARRTAKDNPRTGERQKADGL